MIQLTPLFRVFVASAFVVLPVVSTLIGCNHSPAAAKVGDFDAPALAGWTQEVSDQPWSSRASYKKVTQKNRLIVSLLMFKMVPARTVEDMQKVIRSGGHATMPSSTSYVQVKQVLEQATSLNGMPAVLTQTTYQTKLSNSTAKTLRFANAGKDYLLTASIKVPATSSSSPQAQAELDQAWKTITQKLKP